MQTKELIEKLEELKIKDGKTYHADIINDMGIATLAIIPRVIKALEAGERLRSSVEGMKTPAVIMPNQSQELLQWKQFFNEKIDIALKRFDKGL